MALESSWLDAHLAALGGRVNSRNDLIALYGRWNFDHGVYLSGRMSHGHLTAAVRRVVLLGVSSHTVGSDHDDHVDRATVEFGDTVGAFTPYASATGLRLHQGGFTEQGAGGMGLTAAGDTHDAVLAELGTRWSGSWQWSGGRSVLMVQIAYDHMLSGANPGFVAAFAGVPNATFEIEGQALPGNVVYGDIGLTTHVGRNWSWFVDAGLEESNRSHDSRSVGAGLNAKF